MSATQAARRIEAEAPGLRGLGRVIEVVGWLGVCAAVILGLWIATQETTEFVDSYSGADLESRRMVQEGLTTALVGGFSSVVVAAFGRALQVMSDYMLFRSRP